MTHGHKGRRPGQSLVRWLGENYQAAGGDQAAARY